MIDERSLYINQLLMNYKQGNAIDSSNLYTVSYHCANDKKEQYSVFSHDEGIDFIIQYIKDLEDKINELQYIQKIIDTAK